jgi:hypothetical protein
MCSIYSGLTHPYLETLSEMRLVSRFFDSGMKVR